MQRSLTGEEQTTVGRMADYRVPYQSNCMYWFFCHNWHLYVWEMDIKLIKIDAVGMAYGARIPSKP